MKPALLYRTLFLNLQGATERFVQPLREFRGLPMDSPRCLELSRPIGQIRSFGLRAVPGAWCLEITINREQSAKLQRLGMPIFGLDLRVADPVTLTEMPIRCQVGEIVTRACLLNRGAKRAGVGRTD